MAGILVVDDEAPIRRLMRRVLEMRGHRCAEAEDAAQARQCLDAQEVDLVICDVNMPGESGVDLVRYIAARHPETATMMVTGVDDPMTVEAALDLGVYGYILKPFEPSQVVINVANALRRRDLESESRRQHEILERTVKERTSALEDAVARLQCTERDLREREENLERALADLRMAAGGVIQVVARTVEARDPYTAGHQARVARLGEAIARALGLPQDRINGIRTAGVIHDLGKISIPAEILSKPARLSEVESALMKTHSRVGHDILAGVPFPWPVARMILEHHERMDGSGYPQGLRGGEMLPESRILAVADVVEAMASHRPYRPALGSEAALQEIQGRKGTLYDAEVVEACVAVMTGGFDLARAPERGLFTVWEPKEVEHA